jgi:hypothetical protein
VISSLIEHGILEKIIGELPPKPLRIALPIWAIKPPKRIFSAFASVAKALTVFPLEVYVDDLCPRLYVHRSSSEQEDINEQFRDFFNELGCSIKFSSEIQSDREGAGFFYELVSKGRQVSFNQFLKCLPKDKRERLMGVELKDMLHTLLELKLLDQISATCNCLIVGRFSQAMVVLHRQTARTPLPALITPKFLNDEHVQKYTLLLEQISNK